MTTQDPTLTLPFRNAMLIALGLTVSTLTGAGGCADREGVAICVDSEIDYATCTAELDPGLEPPGPDDPDVRVEEVCFDGTDGCDPCDAEAITAAAIEHTDARCSIIDLHHVTLLCGPDPAVDDCCYKVRMEGDFSCSTPGRPLLAGVDRAPRLAALRTGGPWLTKGDSFAGLRRPRDPETAEALRSYWIACARYEHASVAAFGRVSLQLLSLGAPAALLRASQAAMVDEVRHARACFGLAAAYGGAPASGAGALRVDGAVAGGMDLETALREAIFEGALGEGAAAMEARAGASSCEDPVVREFLLRVAEDEQRHALLAYQTVKWALVAHPRAREIVRECLREGQRRASSPAGGAGDDGGLRGYGVISADRRSWIRHECWTEVVAPLLGAMLGEGGRLGVRSV